MAAHRKAQPDYGHFMVTKNSACELSDTLAFRQCFSDSPSRSATAQYRLCCEFPRIARRLCGNHVFPVRAKLPVGRQSLSAEGDAARGFRKLSLRFLRLTAKSRQLSQHGACTAVADEPLKGPASYFPSIEKKYGRPIAEWQEIVRKHLPAKHMELVAMLKNDHGMGHGHANALVAHTLEADKG